MDGEKTLTKNNLETKYKKFQYYAENQKVGQSKVESIVSESDIQNFT